MCIRDSTGPWGGTDHCPTVLIPSTSPSWPPDKTMVYKFVAHAYRIDTSTPARAALGPLQQSQTGGLLGDADVWNDLAYGFTDLQAAERIYRPSPPPPPNNDPDVDGDVKRDWYSDCLLYTSDAADERSSVDLGGRRI